MVKRAIRHPDRRLPSYRDWESRTQHTHYDCSKARQVLGWNPTNARDEIIRRGIQQPALESFPWTPPSGGKLIASSSINNEQR